MLLGFVFSLCGDVVLILASAIKPLFAPGVAAFAVAHVLYILGFSIYVKPSFRDLAFCLPIFIPLTALISNFQAFSYQGLYPVVLVYTAIISYMVAKALRMFRYREESRGCVFLVMVGAGLFLISDVCLLFTFFYKGAPHALSLINGALYYLGQGLLALSLRFTFAVPQRPAKA
jgi:hypothetical protein